MFAFNQSARGYEHLLESSVCQDSSSSFQDPKGRYEIIICADGHSASSCCRSFKGSDLAAKCALQALGLFARGILFKEGQIDLLQDRLRTHLNLSKQILQELVYFIHRSWLEAVIEDFEKNPLTNEEIMQIQEPLETMRIPRLYGTTLIAALRLEESLFLFQQGDGRCQLFYEDGSFDQPIPWDARCQGSMTTSLCDRDALKSYRTFYLDLKQKPILACFLGSDGIEDAFRDSSQATKEHACMQGVRIFFEKLMSDFLYDRKDAFIGQLENRLEDFSKQGILNQTGSQDDISVAGILVEEKIKPYKLAYYKDYRIYSLEEEQFWLSESLCSKKRKYDFLQKKSNEAHKQYETELAVFREMQKRKDDMLLQKEQMQKKRRYIEEEYAHLLRDENNTDKRENEPLDKSDYDYLIRFKKEASINRIHTLILKMEAEIGLYDKKLEAYKKQMSLECQKALAIIEKFHAYDKTCQNLKQKLEEVKAEIEMVSLLDDEGLLNDFIQQSH